MIQHLFISKYRAGCKLFLMMVLFLSGSNFLPAQNKDALYIDSAGRVGIGTNTPRAILTVGANLSGILSPVLVTNAGALGTTQGSKLYLASIGFTSNNTTSLGIKALRTSNGADWNTTAIGLSYDVDATSPVNNSEIWMHSKGNIGIGITNPAYKLDVNGNFHSLTEIYTNTYLRGDAETFLYSRGSIDGSSNAVLRKDNNFAYIYPWGTGTAKNTVVVGGAINTNLSVSHYVGIGTNDPQVPLDIKDAGTKILLGEKLSWIMPSSNFRDKGSIPLHDNRTNNYGGTVSVRATGIVVADNFFTMSDARMKTEMVQSDAKKDLGLINQLKVTDYYYKDMSSHGGQKSKGFVAQQVEQLLPQAIEKHADFIPDIFMMADKAVVVNGILNISMTQQHHLADGDMVRLITEDGMKEVQVKIINDKTFGISDWSLKTNMVFVYGKKVNDFKTVNYQQIFTLGISAIQELSKQVKELKLENNNLNNENTVMLQSLTDVQAKLTLLEKKIEMLTTAAGK